MNVRIRSFGTTSGGETLLYTLQAENVTAAVTNFGAALVSFAIRGEDGTFTDVALGYDDAQSYEKGHSYIGATVGRHANRIGRAHFMLNGTDCRLAANENGNNLHSGPDLYGSRIFHTDEISCDGRSVTFSLESPDGDQGYPGNLKMSVTYTLTGDGSLRIHYAGRSDADTIFNPTNHSYFNLNGEGSGTILDHEIEICADRFVCIDAESIPTGELRNVNGTPFDFTGMKPIRRVICAADEQIKKGSGYDHCFCLADNRTSLRRAAIIRSPASHIQMEVYTDLPGIQFYTGNFLRDERGKNGHVYHEHDGFALETEYYPDSINHPSFAQPVLRSGETFSSDTVYRLLIKN